jgi:hypothetical protein
MIAQESIEVGKEIYLFVVEGTPGTFDNDEPFERRRKPALK